MDANRQKVEKLLSKKRNIEIELNNIQSECNHNNKVISMVHQGSSHEVRWVCRDCSIALGWPSEQERNKFLNNS